jgi:MoaA/NifB/PqqE/SkfB family radical SAM enzyme
MNQKEPIRCWYFEHAYDAQFQGPCCFQPIPNIASRTKMLQSPIYNEIKQSFDQGKWPENYCTTCRNAEILHPGKNFSKRLGLANYIDLYSTESNVQDFMQLTVDTGRYCNIQCRYCRPSSSSSWIPEALKLPNTIYNYDISVSIENLDVWPSAVYDYTDDDFKNLKFVNIIGGEPLYNMNKLSIFLEKVLDSAGPDTCLNINTNGTVSYKDIPILKKFNKINLVVSFEAIEKKFEFIRTGADWNKFNLNLIDFKSQGFNLASHPTHSILNLFGVVEYIEYMKNLGISLTNEIGFVSYPPYLTYSILTEQEKDKISSYLNDNDLHFLKAYIDNSAFDLQCRKKFYRYMEHTRNYHGMDWREYLPELYELMGDN